jgi:uncharacterized membrane protein
MGIIKSLRYVLGGILAGILFIPALACIILMFMSAIFMLLVAMTAIIMAYAVVFVLPIPNNIEIINA